MTDPQTVDPLELSRLIASHPEAQTALAGPKPAASRSLWSLLSFKVKALLFGLVAAGAVGVAPPGSLSLLGPDIGAAKTGLSQTFGFVGSLSKSDASHSALPGAASASHAAVAATPPSPATSSAPAPRAETTPFSGAVGQIEPVKAPTIAPATRAAASASGSQPGPSTDAAASKKSASTDSSVKTKPSPVSVEDHPLARDVIAGDNRALSSAVAKALPNGGAGMSSSEMAVRLLKVDTFLALATVIENVEHTVYYDPGGTNIAMGYCITKRVAEYGKDRVIADLIGAGLSGAEARSLLTNDKRAHKKIKMTPEGALRLLEITKPDYQRLAEEAYGKEAFDKLPANRQAALTYIAYNTGNVGQFKTLISAAQKGDHVKAMSNLAVRWKDHDGSWQTNNRSRAWLQAAWLGLDHLADAISNPSAFESDASAPHKESVIASLAKPNAIRDKLVAKRSESSAWAFKALGRERAKAASAKSP